MAVPSTHPLGEKAAAHSAYILDDEKEIGALVSQALGTCGYATRQFIAAAPFLEALETSHPGLIVLDLALGQSDAIEVIRQLETLKFKGAILLISGRDEATLAEAAAIGERHGMTMLPPLRKPFRVNEIRSRLAERQPEPAPEANDARPTRTASKKPAVQLVEAMRKNWLELWYQPKIDLRSFSVSGAESLVRARHPDGGIIEPANILPPPGDAAYAPLSSWVVQRAMRDWQHFAERNLPLKLSVNVPVSVIISPDFIHLVRRILPTDPRFPGLVLEVTEDEVIRDPQWMREIATQLKLYNVAISIDDFGSAYASLSRLKDLPVSEIKLDHSFVSGCSSDQSRRMLCQTVVDLAHGFGASVCAEGVETAEDLRALIEMGADEAQGFLFAKAMPPEQLMQKLLAGRGGFGRRAS
jgi:EAL domain-containing protein (putative c-di-GMP-specific phosphodiesterase class I)/FixJ family two-component response regulator